MRQRRKRGGRRIPGRCLRSTGRRTISAQGNPGVLNRRNDGTLTVATPDDDNSADHYTVDYTATVTKPSRWSNVYGDGLGDIQPSVMNNVEGKCLTYTTPALAVNTEITGHPVAHLWVTSTNDDGDFFVYLSEVLPDGTSIYVTEGKLRASHRKISKPSHHDNLGLPLAPEQPKRCISLAG